MYFVCLTKTNKQSCVTSTFLSLLFLREIFPLSTAQTGCISSWAAIPVMERSLTDVTRQLILSSLILLCRKAREHLLASDAISGVTHNKNSYVRLKAPDLGGTRKWAPTMFMCLVICATCACHLVIFSEECLFTDASNYRSAKQQCFT